jgi:hypothetical protein
MKDERSRVVNLALRENLEVISEVGELSSFPRVAALVVRDSEQPLDESLLDS